MALLNLNKSLLKILRLKEICSYSFLVRNPIVIQNAVRLFFSSKSFKNLLRVSSNASHSNYKKFNTYRLGAQDVHGLFKRCGGLSLGRLQRLASSLHTTCTYFSTQGPTGGPTSSGGSNNNKNDDDDDEKKSFFAKTALWMVVAYVLILVVSLIFPSGSQTEVSRYVSWNEFVHQMLAKGEVQELIVHPSSNIVTIVLHEGPVIKGRKMDNDQRVFHMNIVGVGQFESKLRQTEDMIGIRPDQRVQVVYERHSEIVGRLLATAIVLCILSAFFMGMKRSSLKINVNPFSQPHKFTIIDPLLPGSGRGVKFSDVAGAKDAKQEVMEFVDFLNNPAKYQRLGAKVPKGALLLGPPGCGKTMLAKAVATEGQVPFISMNGPEFVEMLGGVGASRVRELFKEAKKRAPCIIYIDEIDAVGRKRSSGGDLDRGSEESEQTLNQLLVEMDGILTKEGVLLLASTNRLDILDKALLRPGRFDRQIIMDLPTFEERKEIFDHHLKSIILEKPVSFYSRRMASLTLGFSGADIANVVNEAALHAARNAKKVVSADDLEYAVERMVGGTEKKTQVLSPDEKRIVAYHESGHALVGWLLKHTDGLLKVTIVPRTTQVLGFAQYAPKDQKLYTQEEIFEKMCMAMGGRVAESLIFNRVTTGAQDDLDKITKMAYAQVRNYGFSEAVGKVSFPNDKESKEAGKRPYSKRLASIIDSEVNKLVFNTYKATEDILRENIDKLKLLAEALLQKETLNYGDVEAIVGPPPHGNKEFIEPVQFENEIKSWKEEGKTEG